MAVTPGRLGIELHLKQVTMGCLACRATWWGTKDQAVSQAPAHLQPVVIGYVFSMGGVTHIFKRPLPPPVISR